MTAARLMPAQNPALHPLSILRAIWKRRGLITILWIAVTGVAVVVIFRLPFVYKAETLVLVDSQRIPERYVVSTVVSDLQERLSTLNQQILSSSRLQSIVDEYHLYAAERRKYAPEEIIAMMRKDITVAVERVGSSRPGAFKISYEGSNPVLVARVANRLASLYMDENLKVREKEAEQTNQFIDRELQEAKTNLDVLEEKVSAYKRDHMGSLPEQESSLSGRLGSIQTAIQNNEDSLNRSQQQLVLLQNSLESTLATERKYSRSPSAVGDSSNDAHPSHPKLDRMGAELSQLRLRYTDNHPDIRRLKDQIAAEEAHERQAETNDTSRPASSVAVAGPIDSGDPARAAAVDRETALRSQIAQVTNELESLKNERGKLTDQLNLYQGRLDLVPVREQEMAALTRDYETSKLNYTSLLNKRLDARMAGNMEKLQKAETFTVLDPAKPPQKPVRPKRAVLTAAATLGSLGLALGIGFLAEFLRDVTLGEWELPIELTVLGRVPKIETIERSSSAFSIALNVDSNHDHKPSGIRFH